MQTVLYGKIKERRDERWMVNWNEHTKNTLPLNCSTQHNTKERHIRRLLMGVKACKQVLVIGKARKARINDG